MKRLLKIMISMAFAIPASSFAASERVEKLEKDTTVERTEDKTELLANVQEADEKLSELNETLEKLKSYQTSHRKVALLSGATSAATAALGILLTLKSPAPESRYAIGNLFGALTTMTAISMADNLNDARLDQSKIEDLQAQVFGAKRKIQELKNQLNLKKGSDL